MNPIEKLDKLLTDAGIPHEKYVERFEDLPYYTPKENPLVLVKCDADEYSRNQIIYGRLDEDVWLLDAIWQRGSYGRMGNLLEVYGSMIGPEPKTYAVDDVFRMIEADWKKR